MFSDPLGWLGGTKKAKKLAFLVPNYFWDFLAPLRPPRGSENICGSTIQLFFLIPSRKYIVYGGLLPTNMQAVGGAKMQVFGPFRPRHARPRGRRQFQIPRGSKFFQYLSRNIQFIGVRYPPICVTVGGEGKKCTQYQPSSNISIQLYIFI